MDEIWKNVVVKGEIYDNYKVSNLGRIISLNYKNTGRAELLKPIERKDGYLQACFSENNKIVTYPWHLIVAEAFLPNPENKPYINHKIEGDEGKKINMVFFNEDGTVDEEKSTIEWVCPECGVVHDRDINAAKNILEEGKRIIGLSSPEFKRVDYPTMDDK